MRGARGGEGEVKGACSALGDVVWVGGWVSGWVGEGRPVVCARRQKCRMHSGQAKKESLGSWAVQRRQLKIAPSMRGGEAVSRATRQPPGLCEVVCRGRAGQARQAWARAAGSPPGAAQLRRLQAGSGWVGLARPDKHATRGAGRRSTLHAAGAVRKVEAAAQHRPQGRGVCKRRRCRGCGQGWGERGGGGQVVSENNRRRP